MFQKHLLLESYHDYRHFLFSICCPCRFWVANDFPPLSFIFTNYLLSIFLAIFDPPFFSFARFVRLFYYSIRNLVLGSIIEGLNIQQCLNKLWNVYMLTNWRHVPLILFDLVRNLESIMSLTFSLFFSVNFGRSIFLIPLIVIYLTVLLLRCTDLLLDMRFHGVSSKVHRITMGWRLPPSGGIVMPWEVASLNLIHYLRLYHVCTYDRGSSYRKELWIKGNHFEICVVIFSLLFKAFK